MNFSSIELSIKIIELINVYLSFSIERRNLFVNFIKEEYNFPITDDYYDCVNELTNIFNTKINLYNTTSCELENQIHLLLLNNDENIVSDIITSMIEYIKDAQEYMLD